MATGGLALALALGALLSAASAQDAPQRYRRATLWDLQLGAHAYELTRDAFAEYACGTNGGPPSIPLSGWADFAECPAEADTGFHEVYFRYDDELQFITRARTVDEAEEVFRFEGTSEYNVPIILTALFDSDGFLRGVRVVTDPRTDPLTRERGANVAALFMIRFNDANWQCTDLPPGEGEAPYMGALINQSCTGARGSETFLVEKRQFRKDGQLTIDPFTHQATTGYFVAETRFERMLTDIPDRAARLAAIQLPSPSERDLLVARAMDCPGCDLSGADLKRADLRGANLAGANLAGANLHAARLDGADLTGANLVGVNLNNASLRRADLAGATISQSMMFGARFDGADLENADFTGNLARQATMIRVNATGAKFVGIDLRESRLSDGTFVGADFSLAWLHTAQMARADLSSATIIGVRFWQASLIEANLTGVDGRSADFIGADLRDADLSGGNFTGAGFNQANLLNVKTEGATFEGALLPPGFRF